MATTKKKYGIIDFKNGNRSKVTVIGVKSSKAYIVGTKTYSANSTKGVESEAYSLLKSKKLVTQKEYKEAGGYYKRSSKVLIHFL